MRLSESYIWAPRMPGPWNHQSVEGELCLRPRLIYGKMSFGAWLCSTTDLLGCGYIGYSLQSSSCPQEQVSWFRPQCGAQRPGLSASSFPVGWATIPPLPVLKGQLWKWCPQLTWMLVPHPNNEAEKHQKCIRAGSRRKRQGPMWPFYSITGLIPPPPQAETYRKRTEWPTSSLSFQDFETIGQMAPQTCCRAT